MIVGNGKIFNNENVNLVPYLSDMDKATQIFA